MTRYTYNRGYRSSRRKNRVIFHRFLPKSKTLRLKLLSYLTTILFFLLVFFIVGTGILFAWYSRDLPRPDRVRRTEGFSTIIYDRNGIPLYDIFGKENRIPTDLNKLPEYVKQATIAIEDKDFYRHKGFSQRGIIRALFNIIFKGRLQGGSTLTQQLVKNVLLSGERTIPRKIKEFILAIQIERKYTKDEILQMYLNEAPYGGATAGIETAAEYYFDKPASELTLTEAVILAGLPQAPSRYSPFNPIDKKAYIWRAEQVARRMREDGYIDKQQEEKIKQELPQITFAKRKTDIKAPHFVFYVRKQLIDRFGEQMVEQGGLRVTTTLDWDLQKKVEEIVSQEIEKLKGLKVGNGAAVVINPQTGEILSLVGSKDFTATEGGAFDVVTQGLRQPGSSIKPITYAAAFRKGYTPSTLLFDVETHFPGGEGQKDYVPKNYDGKYRGPMQLRFALGNSINVIAVKVQALVGVENMLKLASDMGISTLKPTKENIERLGLSVVLGGGEVRLLDLTSAYGVFATGGKHFEPYAIEKVTDNKGKLLWEKKKQKGKQVLSEEVAFLISDILADNDARKDVFGPRSYLHIPGKTVAVKTGTTDDLRDNWTIGYTPEVVVGVWVGNNDNSPMNQQLVSGVTGAAPIWNRIMREILKDKSDKPFTKPDGVIEMEIDAFGGGLPKEGFPTRQEYFIKGTEPTDISPIYQKIKVSKSDPSKKANAVEIATGNYEEKEFFVFTEDDPISTDGVNRWQEAIDAWVVKQEDGRYHPPTEVSQQGVDSVIISISKPSDKEQINDNKVEIIAKAISINDISKLELEVDGQLKLTVHDSRLQEVLNLEDGTHQIRVKGRDVKGNSGESSINIGVNVPWDWQPQPSPTPIPEPTLTPTVTPSPSPTP